MGVGILLRQQTDFVQLRSRRDSVFLPDLLEEGGISNKKIFVIVVPERLFSLRVETRGCGKKGL